MSSRWRTLAVGGSILLLAFPALGQDDEGETPAAETTAQPDETDETTVDTTDGTESPAPPTKRRRRRRRVRLTPPAQERAEKPEGTAADEPAPKTERAAVAPAPAAAAPEDPLAPKPAPAAAPDETKPAAAAPIDALATIDVLPAIAPTEAVPAAAAPVEQHPPAEHAAPPTAAAVAPTAAHGAGHGEDHGAGHDGHQGFSVATFVAQLVNFGALLFILIYFGGRALNKYLRERHDRLRGDIDEATRLRDRAKQSYDAQAKRIAELEQEIAALRESMRKDAEREQARMLEAAKVRAQQMQETMQRQIEAEVKVAEAELRAEAARASVALAEELVRKSVSFEDERRLAREFVAGFAGSAGPGGGLG